VVWPHRSCSRSRRASPLRHERRFADLYYIVSQSSPFLSLDISQDQHPPSRLLLDPLSLLTERTTTFFTLILLQPHFPVL